MARTSRRVYPHPLGEGYYSQPIPPIVFATMSILGPTSRGCHLSPAMRLVATMMLLWYEDWPELTNGRYGMTPAEIADRTSLTETQVRATLAKLVEVKLVRERADGWELTIKRWQDSVLKPWVAQANSRLYSPPHHTR